VRNAADAHELIMTQVGNAATPKVRRTCCHQHPQRRFSALVRLAQKAANDMVPHVIVRKTHQRL
jgi:hypothetical protein